MLEYAALVASPHALPDGLSLVFQHPVREKKRFMEAMSISFMTCTKTFEKRPEWRIRISVCLWRWHSWIRNPGRLTLNARSKNI